MRWRTLFYEPKSDRLRCWWRAALYLCVASAATFALLLLLASVSSTLAHTPLLANRSQETIIAALLQVATIAGFLFAAGWALRTLEQLPVETLGLHPRGMSGGLLLAGLLVGIGLPLLIAGLLSLTGQATLQWRPMSLSLWQHFGLLSLSALLFTVAEEVVVHGYLFQTMLRGIGAMAALLLVSALACTFFALQHPQNSPLQLVNTFLLVMLLGLLYLRSGSLWAPIGLSTGWSIGLLLCNYSSSAGNMPLLVQITGPRWLTGSASDPMSGAAASLVLLIAIGLLTHMRYGLALDSQWWEWRHFFLSRRQPPAWDFTIGSAYYQFKLGLRKEVESGTLE